MLALRPRGRPYRACALDRLLEVDHVLIAVSNLEAAAHALDSRHGLASAARGPLGWVVRTDALDNVASRLGLSSHDGSRQRADGSVVRWRLAGVEAAAGESSLPFFIEWAPGTVLPGRASATHPAGPVGFTRVELGGKADRIASWLGNERLPYVVHAAPPRVDRVVLDARGRTIVVDATSVVS